MQKLLITVILLLMAKPVSAYQDERSRSKFFDGRVFSNPVRNSRSFWQFLGMRLTTSYAKWPEWIEAPSYKPLQERVQDSDIHITTINHASVLVQFGGLNIITDPIYSERCSPFSWVGPKRIRNPGVKFEDLPKIDIILVSHNHYDHLDLPTIRRLIERDQPRIYMGLGVGKSLDSMENVKELDWWESTTDGNAKIHFVPVQHFSGRTLFDRNTTLWGAFVVEAEGRRFYFGGDTGYYSHFKETRMRIGRMDVSLLPIGAYEPREFMGYAHINPEEAVQAHLDLGSKNSVAIHYGVFQLTAEPVNEPIEHLELAKKTKGVANDAFVAPEFGKTLIFPKIY